MSTGYKFIPRGMEWDRVRGKVKGGGNICVLVTDSHCCMAEMDTIL